MKAPKAAPRPARAAPKAPAPAQPVPRPAAPAPRAPTYDDVLQIVRLIESGSRFSEFRLRSGDIEVEVKRGAPHAQAHVHGLPVQAPAPVVPPAAPAQPAGAPPTPPSPPVVQHAASPLPSLPANATLVKSPMVGTFYRSPEPGSPPFVEVGSRVEPDTLVCIIEVMKLMNSVTAGVTGVVTHILAGNAQMVEQGQVLIVIQPA